MFLGKGIRPFHDVFVLESGRNTFDRICQSQTLTILSELFFLQSERSSVLCPEGLHVDACYA